MNSWGLVFPMEGLRNLRYFTQILTPLQIKIIMRDLLLSISAFHSKGIFHRDLKPSNIILVREKEGLLRPIIIDWGLAEYLLPDKDYNYRVSTRPFKAPEILLKQTRYDQKIDIWSLGCIFAGLLFQRDFMFPSHDDLYTMNLIIGMLGRHDLDRYLSESLISINETTRQKLSRFLSE